MRRTTGLVQGIVFFCILFGLFLQGNDGITQTMHESLWDEDGGFEADYSGIPRLEWSGPGAPGTYEEYLLGRKRGPLQTRLVYSSILGGGGDRALKALILVNANILAGITAKLDIYVSLLEAEGYTVEVHTTTAGNPKDLKNFILAHSTDLVGCVLVGDHPVAWYEIDDGGSHDEFPCDLYYMELDGLWIDVDSDGLFDDLQPGSGDEGPEIFIGHIDASMMVGDEVTLTNDYLDKNIAYRTGAFYAPDHALSYTEDDWVPYMDIRTDIKNAYPSFEDLPAPATNRNDYLDNRVPNPDYEFVQMCCHSSSAAHHFTREGLATNSDIIATVPSAIFFNLFACSSLRWTQPNFLGGSYIYNTSKTTLGVIGSTKSGSMLSFHAFYKPFGNLKTFGEAFRKWFNYLAPYNAGEISWHFGMTIAGDPFLRILEPALTMEFPDGLPQGNLPPGPETPITLEIVPGLQNIKPGSGLMHYRFDKGASYTTAAVSHLGGDLYEAVIPHTKPGDTPEFYFTVEGDGGAIIHRPYGAPETVYSFDVCIESQIFEDDFETDKGWIVQSWFVQTGEWERGDPVATGVQPGNDHTPSGTKCFVTGKLGGANSANDVDGGPNCLLSPALDLSSGDGQISFYLWFHHSYTGKHEPLQVQVSNNGISWIPVASISHNPSWQLLSFKVSDYVVPSSNVRVRFWVKDNPDDDIVEALVDDVTVKRLEYAPSLWADAYSIPVATGTAVDFSIGAGAGNGNRSYLLLGSITGTSPGTTLPGGSTLPLNWDIFTDMILSGLGSQLFYNFTGNLDVSGEATATLNTTGALDPSLAGIVMHFAYILYPAPYFVSNPIAVTIE